MANILISILTLAIGVMLATYGAYTDLYSTQRTQLASKIGRAMERQLTYVDSAREDLGRVPDPTDLVTARFSSENRDGVDFTYGKVGSTGFICARAVRSEAMVQAMTMVRDQRPGIAVLGADCNSNTGPSATRVSVSLRIN